MKTFFCDDNEGTSEEESDWHVLLYGMPRIKNTIILAPGLSIKPLDSPLSVFDLASAGVAGFREWAMLEPFAHLCDSEIETTSDSAVLPGYDTLNRAWLAISLLILKGYSTTLGVAYNSYSWSRVAGYKKRTLEGIINTDSITEGELPNFKGGLLDVHRQFFMTGEYRKNFLNQEDIDWISNNYETFNKFAAESKNFRLALESAIDWRYLNNSRMAIASLWAGIEAVIGISSELNHRISLYCSSLLTERGQARKEFFDKVKKLYIMRSKAVHGDSLEEGVLVGAMQDSYELLNKLLLLSIEKGHILGQDDFDHAVFY